MESLGYTVIVRVPSNEWVEDQPRWAKVQFLCRLANALALSMSKGLASYPGIQNKII